MVQGQLPIFSKEITLINQEIGVQEKEGVVFYFHGQLPLFRHDKADNNSFRFITSQMYLSNTAKQTEISEAFGVPLISVKRNVKLLRTEGIEGFFEAKNREKTSPVLTPDVVIKIEESLNQGMKVPEISKKLNIKRNTINQAIRKGKIKKKRNNHHLQPRNFPRKVKEIRRMAMRPRG